MNNWEITVNNPVLTPNMKFLVRYKKMPDGNWVDLLPSPTTNTFTINSLEDDHYQAEIKVMCENGTISTPKIIDLKCNDSGVGNNEIGIRWNDGGQVENCDLQLGSCSKLFGVVNFDKFVMVHLEKSTNNVNFETVTVLSQDSHTVQELFEGEYYYRCKGTDANNISTYSNTLLLRVIRSVDYACETHVFKNTNPVITKCTCGPPRPDGTGAPCNDNCPSGEEEYNFYQNPQTVTWKDCDTGQTMSATLNYGETITVNRRI